MEFNELANYIRDNARSVADLADLTLAQSTSDPHLARTLRKQLRKKYEPDAEAAVREEIFGDWMED